MEKEVVLAVSGGLDSAIALYKLKEEGYNVYGVFFEYGQENIIEKTFAQRLCHKFGVILSINKLASMNTLSSKSPFVLHRNLLFLIHLHQIAEIRGVENIAMAISGAEASSDIYPDATKEFLISANDLLITSSNKYFKLLAPILGLDKEALYKFAYEKGILELAKYETYSCYSGRVTKHYWGIGCGNCISCESKKAYYDKFAYKLGNSIEAMQYDKHKPTCLQDLKIGYSFIETLYSNASAAETINVCRELTNNGTIIGEIVFTVMESDYKQMEPYTMYKNAIRVDLSNINNLNIPKL